jgi:hypothetical protein
VKYELTNFQFEPPVHISSGHAIHADDSLVEHFCLVHQRLMCEKHVKPPNQSLTPPSFVTELTIADNFKSFSTRKASPS